MPGPKVLLARMAVVERSSFFVSRAELVACKELAALDLAVVARDIPGTTPNIVFISFVLVLAVILRDFCLTKHRGNKPPQCATHVGQRLGLLNCHHLLCLHLCPCQATSMVLQLLAQREGNGGLRHWHLWEGGETARRGGDPPPTV